MIRCTALDSARRTCPVQIANGVRKPYDIQFQKNANTKEDVFYIPVVILGTNSPPSTALQQTRFSRLSLDTVKLLHNQDINVWSIFATHISSFLLVEYRTINKKVLLFVHHTDVTILVVFVLVLVCELLVPLCYCFIRRRATAMYNARPQEKGKKLTAIIQMQEVILISFIFIGFLVVYVQLIIYLFSQK